MSVDAIWAVASALNIHPADLLNHPKHISIDALIRTSGLAHDDVIEVEQLVTRLARKRAVISGE